MFYKYIAKFWKIIDKINKHRITTLIFLIGGYLVIFQTGLGTFLLHLIYQEPTTYIIKSRIEYVDITTPYTAQLNDKSDNFYGRTELYDVCGMLFVVSVIYPRDIPELRKSNTAFLRFGQENVTYSVSIITKKQSGVVPLFLHSQDTKFAIQKKTASVREVGDSVNIEGLTEKRVDIDLSSHLNSHEKLFDIVPEKDKKINIDCLIKNCKIGEMKYTLAPIPPNLNLITVSTFEDDGTPYEMTAPTPLPNVTSLSAYMLDLKSNNFVKISTEDSKDAYMIAFGSPLPCNKEGKLYVRPH